jgi:S-adenosylmethionine hydrolase
VPTPRWVTLSTDFGSVYSAQVKGVLATLAPEARVVELTSELPAHRVEESAFLLAHMAKGFPAGTTHLAVVDPGVGTDRAPIVIRCPGGTHLVGPDNGLLAPLATALGGRDAFRIERTKVPGPTAPSVTFDGRDLFAPAAALLACRRPLRGFATPHPFRRYDLPIPSRDGEQIDGEVLHVDRFGNLITNVPPEWIPPGRPLRLRIDRGRFHPLPTVRTYAERSPGQLAALASSFGTLEISARGASAAARLGAGAGARVHIVAGGGVGNLFVPGG